VVYFDGIVGEFNYFSGHLAADFLWVSPVLQVEVIRVDLDFVGRSSGQGSQVSERLDNCQEF
jgi:hypothetical protein